MKHATMFHTRSAFDPAEERLATGREREFWLLIHGRPSEATPTRVPESAAAAAPARHSHVLAALAATVKRVAGERLTGSAA